jgi:hypothetical protein
MTTLPTHVLRRLVVIEEEVFHDLFVIHLLKEKAMLKPHTFVTYSLAAVMTLAFVSPSSVHAQAGKKGKANEVKIDAQKSRGGEAEDPNIKSNSVENNPDRKAATPAPPEKGGEKTRGGSCIFKMDNATPWKIKLFIDGDYVALLPPWGDATSTYNTGGHAVYLVASFTDGSKITWGPESMACGVTWRLTDTSHGYN